MKYPFRFFAHYCLKNFFSSWVVTCRLCISNISSTSTFSTSKLRSSAVVTITFTSLCLSSEVSSLPKKEQFPPCCFKTFHCYFLPSLYNYPNCYDSVHLSKHIIESAMAYSFLKYAICWSWIIDDVVLETRINVSWLNQIDLVTLLVYPLYDQMRYPRLKWLSRRWFYSI